MEISDKMKMVVARIELEHNQDLKIILHNLYITQQLTYRKILKILNINGRTVKILLDFCEIPIRYGGEAIKAQWVNNDKRRKEQSKFLFKLTNGKPSRKIIPKENILKRCKLNDYTFLKRIRNDSDKLINIVKCNSCGSILKYGYHKLEHKHCNGKIKSRGELKICDFLNRSKIIYETQHYINDGSKRMFFDFMIKINGIKILIEYDGRQHFDKKSKYYCIEQVENDLYKNRYCKSMNINLIRIPFYYYKYLDECLNYQIQQQLKLGICN